MVIGHLIGSVTGGQVLRYMLLPQIVPRIRAMGETGFSNLAYLMALVYRAVNLLPPEHPAFLRENRNKLGLRQVIGMAAANLTFSRNHIDQIAIFFTILAGMALLALQFVLIVGYVMLNPALAQEMPTTYGEFFADPHAEDLVYIMLYAIFGVPELFKAGAERQEFHVALHSLFQFYSIGLLVVAVIIVCYFIFAIVVETAQTGVPFGKRYNHVWTPLRLVVALGLLIPAGYGLNSAQWITLYAAKFGSDYATKGWTLFNEKMNQEYLVDVASKDSLVATPKRPNINSVAAFMTVAKTCHETYLQKGNKKSATKIKAYVIQDAKGESTGVPMTIDQFISSEQDAYKEYKAQKKKNKKTADMPRKKDVMIRFGIWDSKAYPDEAGDVYPYCGELSVMRADATEPGSAYIQQFYLELVRDLWNGDYGIGKAAEKIAKYNLPAKEGETLSGVNESFKYTAIKSISKKLDQAIKDSVTKQINSETWARDAEEIEKYGWGGAGIWYNKIAQINGSLVAGINNIPQIRSRPALMNFMANRTAQANNENPEPFSEAAGKGHPVPMGNENDKILIKPMDAAYKIWKDDAAYGDFSGQGTMTGNAFIDMVNLIFGTQGLFAMCQNTDIHPLAQLSQLGKGLVDSAIRNIGGGVLFSAGSMILPDFWGQASGAIGGILMSVATITIVMGFILYHVIPFMPFLYFFFAVGGWIKGLFEAMVGVPLWALAFLRIDGDGLPGSSAMDGFYLILEIFLRPIMIIFGLLASIIVFAAMVKILNEIFFIVVYNVTGNDPGSSAMCGAAPAGTETGSEKSAIEFFRGPIDELFFTIMYAIIVYMIGMSCFKLIDQIPNNILRYMGASVNTFNDKAADPTDGLITRLSVGGSMVSGRVLGSARDGGIFASLGDAVKNTGAGVQDVTKPKTPPSNEGTPP